MSTRKRRQKEVEEESPPLDNNQGDDDEEEEEAPPRSKDAPSELAVDRIVDMIDFEIEHILWERMSRKDHFESLEVSRCRSRTWFAFHRHEPFLDY